MKDVRIQKVLSEQGVCSRRAAEQIIREGRVKLNGRPVSVGDKMDTHRDLLTVDGQQYFELEEGDDIVVEKSRSRALLIASGVRNYTQVLSSKLNWSGGMHA